MGERFGAIERPYYDPAQIDTTQLQRQARSQSLDAKSEAERIEKELHAIEQIKHSEGGVSGKAAQLGKLELARRELLDTSLQRSQVQQGSAESTVRYRLTRLAG
ncbi:hypothetical protein [Allochromatium palmeri]|uniref:hypothetical protein n=1 Tax=Allochromatium palmeri TaxID=231048 RepID=UPI001642F09A|nr:hypothetical protein [Allochromatium palmeri]